MSDSQDRQLDAYLAGDLSAREQRTLAQAALDDPELFDLLASAAVVKAASVDSPAVVVRRSNKTRVVWIFAGAAAAAAAIVTLVAVYRSSSYSEQTPPAVASSPSTTPRVAQAAPSPKVASQPVILSARLDALTGSPTVEFRTAASASRLPKDAGAVVATEDGEVTIDLGSLDGLTKGSQLEVLRGGGPQRLTITTVFRERSRGRMASGESVQIGDRVEVSPAAQLNALLEHALARIAAGDDETARTLAARAVPISAAVSGADAADTMNELAAISIRYRDDPAAETLLRRAQMYAAGLSAVRVANNLAALAALRGDVANAESMYRSALTLAAGSAPPYESARRSIETNLQALK